MGNRRLESSGSTPSERPPVIFDVPIPGTYLPLSSPRHLPGRILRDKRLVPSLAQAGRHRMS